MSEAVFRKRAACTVCALALAALAALAAQAPAQEAQAKPEKLPKWRIDPYTRNEPEALAKAGYVSFGPFPFGNVGTNVVLNTSVDQSFPYLQFLWIETKHFRLGCNLPEWVVPMEPDIRAKIRAELTRLAEKLPRVNPKTRTLDPWLRAHLFAQRLEDTYAEFSRLAGVKDEDFPKDDKAPLGAGARYMGMGPFLGMREKYLVLLFEKESPFRSYMKGYLGRDSRFGQRWHCKDVGALLFTVATECDEHRLKNDTALHCHVAFNVSQNLMDGFRHYSYDLPVWMREGLGHWFERNVHQEHNSFDQNEGSTADMKDTWKWKSYCRNLVVTGGKFAPFPETFAWRDFGQITFNDHVAIWSRIDWLMSMGPEKWSAFLFHVKGRMENVNGNWTVDQKDLVGATREALQKVYGLSPLEFDAKWGEWVKATYPVMEE